VSQPTLQTIAVRADGAAMPQPIAAENAAAMLLKLEAEIRRTRSFTELAYCAANETRAVTRAQQAIVLARGVAGRMAVRAVSATAVVDRSAPLVVWFEGLIATLAARHDIASPLELDADAITIPGDTAGRNYPLRHMLWVPLLGLDGAVRGGLLNARSVPWSEADVTVARHIADAVAISWCAIEPGRRLGLWPALSRRAAILSGAGALVLACLPVSMSALAPVEVVPRDPLVVTAAVDGVIDVVEVQPSATVSKDQLLVRMADTVARNRLEIAERELVLADIKLKRASQLAFVDLRGRHEMALAQSERELRMAERDYARDLLARGEVRAGRAGVAVFADRKDLIGKPVTVGERLMEIADLEAMDLRIDLPVADAIVVNTGARVKVFLDSDPLRPIEARLLRADYQARPREGQQLAFRLVAAPEPADGKSLRLGIRGTAQVYGDKVALAYYVLRRPISAARQWLGL